MCFASLLCYTWFVLQKIHANINVASEIEITNNDYYYKTKTKKLI